MKLNAMKRFLLVYTIILAINLFLFLFLNGSKPLEESSPLRFVLSALMIFLMPGLVWGELLRFRSKHILQTIALGFAISISIETVLLIVPFVLNSTIRLWVVSIFLVSFAGLVLLFLQKRSDSFFIEPLWSFYKEGMPFKLSVPIISSIVLIICVVLYNWGENIFSIDGEKLLHLTYVRYYSSMSLSIRDLGIYKGMPPLNLIHLWEFLIAGWSVTANVDPLIFFSHARALIPILGFSSMYLLISAIFTNKLKTEFVMWATIIMCLGWFVLLSPSGLDWVKEDTFRGLMSFMSTAHHADSAMEILLPLLAGLGLMTLRDPKIKHYLLLAVVLFAAFLWHTREFFQSAVYLGIIAITIAFSTITDKKILLRRIAVIVAIFLVIAAFFYVSMGIFASEQKHTYDEFKLKEIALSYGLQSMFDVRSPFHFPNDLRLTMGLNKDVILPFPQISDYIEKSWNFYFWLVLSAFSILILIYAGRREDRQFSMFYLLLWFLTLCWGFSQFMLIVLTYSEINFTLPRMIYLFSYIAIGAGFYVLFERLQDSCVDLKRMLIVYVGFLIAGLFFMLWWRLEVPLAKVLSYLFSILFLFSFIALYYPKLSRGGLINKSEFFPAVLAVFIFFVPLLAYDYMQIGSKAVLRSNQPINWFGNDNPFNMSQGLIENLRKIEPKKTVLVNPFSTSIVSLYAPLYYPIVPEIMGKTLVTASETYKNFREGGHPLFHSTVAAEIRDENITLRPSFRSDFSAWKSGVSIKNDIAKIAPPMVLHSRQGDFIFEKKGNVVRVKPVKGASSSKLFLSFGYAQGDNGFNMQLRPNEDVLLLVSARLSEKAKGQALAFVLDVAGGQQELSKAEIKGHSIKRYSVAKKVRRDLQSFVVGIQWEPGGEDEYLEFTDMRIYKADDIGRYIKLQDSRVDHLGIKEWLRSNRVDYILVRADDYNRLSSYFSENVSDYEIIFNNKDNKEILVKVRVNKQ